MEGIENGSKSKKLLNTRLLYKMFYDLSFHFTISHVYGRSLGCPVEHCLTKQDSQKEQEHFQLPLCKLKPKQRYKKSSFEEAFKKIVLRKTLRGVNLKFMGTSLL